MGESSESVDNDEYCIKSERRWERSNVVPCDGGPRTRWNGQWLERAVRVSVGWLGFLTHIARGNILTSVGKKARPIISSANQLDCSIPTKVAGSRGVMSEGEYFRAEG